MNIKFYMICCNSCAVGTYHKIKAKDVQITLNLEKNEYIFEAICPVCSNELYSTRSMR